MKIDRSIQLEILKAAADTHPAPLDIAVMRQLLATHGEDVMAANLRYLAGHGLIDRGVTVGADGHFSFKCPEITADGIDFLLDDGGLSAILGVVTIRFHDETLRELIGFRISQSDLSQPDKSRLLGQLRELRGETIKHLTLKLVDAGLANWPVALQAIETFVRRSGF
ncbi:hypothetical protein [Paraburkholderia dioscoreae]|jgi:hypothetical protein|uniref:Uncharacterized protein n=1 Tax=Paraburkholderia dioscoreae TaxID=2604047 RepID=A0A5Q4ZD96_9BURK|nr:hypothetical protein [Paraburkholderia dioscoreae]VVD29187.1 conserved protein of unknown function [Paraburkholderia dioscoreae]